MAQPPHPVSYFDLSHFPWTPQRCDAILQQRASLGGQLFIDRLLAIVGIDSFSLYPPQTPEAFAFLCETIDASAFDNVKKQCLYYYLQLAWNDDRHQAYAQHMAIPKQFLTLSTGYYCLDLGEIERAVTLVSDPRVTADFTPYILQAIATVPDPIQRAKLTLRFVRMGKPLLERFEDMALYLSALCESNFIDGWQYQRTLPESNAHRSKLLQLILDFCLAPPRPAALKILVALPFTAYEHSQVTAYALTPPSHISEKALAILHELINVRLIHQGQYSEAIRLDRQFSYTPYAAHAGAVSKGLESRRITTKELLAALPEVQRKLLDVHSDTAASARVAPAPVASGASTPGDMSMSWEHLEKSTSRLSASTSSFLRTSQFLAPPSIAASAASSSTPLSASQAFRQSNSATAMLNAFAESSGTMEGSPTPGSRYGLTGGTNNTHSPKRALAPAVTAPFGMVSSGLGKMMHVQPFSIAKKDRNTVEEQQQQQRPLFGANAAQSARGGAGRSSLSNSYRPSQPISNPIPLTNVRPKRSFGQVARSPESSFIVVDQQKKVGDLSLSDLRGGPQAEDEDTEQEEEDDDDLVLNASRSAMSFAGRPIVQPPAVSANGKGKEKEEVKAPPKDFPGAFAIEEEEDDEEEEEQAPPPPPPPKKKAPPPPIKRETRRRSTATNALATSTTSTTKPTTPKKTGTRTSRGGSKAPSVVPEEEQPIIRRSSRLSKAGSPERKKARSEDGGSSPGAVNRRSTSKSSATATTKKGGGGRRQKSILEEEDEG